MPLLYYQSNIREDISDKASTSESTETEDMEAEAESSASEDEKEEEEEEEPVSRGSMMGGNSALPNPARCYTAADVAAANAAWDLYKARNNSVVVDTFQGQFKSTVSVWCGWVRACARVHAWMWPLLWTFPPVVWFAVCSLSICVSLFLFLCVWVLSSFVYETYFWDVMHQ